jgi:hypothetical protein
MQDLPGAVIVETSVTVDAGRVEVTTTVSGGPAGRVVVLVTVEGAWVT